MRSADTELEAVTIEALTHEVDVTLLFCDVVRSTELTRRLGDRGAYRVIRSFHDSVSRAGAPHQGEELELRGDGVLLGFQRPEQAVACAIEIQRRLAVATREPRIHARIGIHTGPALRIPGGYFGANVILAARVAEAAAPGEILASVELVQMLGSEASVDAGRWVALKGIPEQTLLFALRRSSRAQAGSRGTSSDAAPRLVPNPFPEAVGADEASCMLAERGAV